MQVLRLTRFPAARVKHYSTVAYRIITVTIYHAASYGWTFREELAVSIG